MVETLQNLMSGFALALSPSVLMYAFVGCVVGTLVGILPGVGPLAGISLLLAGFLRPRRDQCHRFIGGHLLWSDVRRLNDIDPHAHPGEAASVMTCIDGYAMTQKGRGGAALAIAAVGSFVAGTLSVIALMLLAPPLAEFALRFRSAGKLCVASTGTARARLHERGSMAKSLTMAALGLLLGMIGIDTMSGYFRFHYGCSGPRGRHRHRPGRRGLVRNFGDYALGCTQCRR